MQTIIDINHFISSYVTKREESLLRTDLEREHDALRDKLTGKKVLVIGGAGTIGSYYIKALLKYQIKSLVVVDINENGLTGLVRDLRSSTVYNIPTPPEIHAIHFNGFITVSLSLQTE